MLIMSVAFLGCSGGDSQSECAVISCQNGGQFSNCACACPAGFTGTNCGTQLTPSKIKISKIKVTMFPNTSSGDNWDLDGFADIYIEMDREVAGAQTTDVYLATSYYPDVLSDGSNSFEFIPETPIEISQVSTGHTLTLLDYDGDDTVPSLDDTMGIIAFYPYVAANAFPSVLYLNNDTIPLRYELTMTYEW